MAARVLLVEPHDRFRSSLEDAALEADAFVDVQSDFEGARRRLSEFAYDFLVVNVRLGAYNGVHLVYLDSARGFGARSILYTVHHDAGLAEQAREAGAFYETFDRLPVALKGYLHGALPARDRRDPVRHDRRTAAARGGRRRWDRHLVTRPRPVAGPVHDMPRY
jgi:DNA-binding NtrC family response regulator